MALRAASVSTKEARATGDGGGRTGRTATGRIKADREKAQAAQFVRLVNGFEARLQEIDLAMTSVMKRLAG
jgi:hypothetical protein